MPAWVQFIIGLAAFFGAAAVLWTSVLRPIIRIGAETTELEHRLEQLEQRVKDLEDG